MISIFQNLIKYKIQFNAALVKFLLRLDYLQPNKGLKSTKNWPKIPPNLWKWFLEKFCRTKTLNVISVVNVIYSIPIFKLIAK